MHLCFYAPLKAIKERIIPSHLRPHYITYFDIGENSQNFGFSLFHLIRIVLHHKVLDGHRKDVLALTSDQPTQESLHHILGLKGNPTLLRMQL